MSDRPIEIRVRLPDSQNGLLQGLQQWQQLGLLTGTQVNLSLFARGDRPELLAGLEEWVRLGLLSEEEVLRLGREQLCCQRLSAAAVATSSTELRSKKIAYLLWLPGLVGLCGLQRLYVGEWFGGLLWLFTFGLVGIGQLVDLALIPMLVDRFNQKQGLSSVSTPSDTTERPGEVIARVARSLTAEFSVLWLLLLGVFGVVAGSGVLALQVWQVLPAAGQYGILWLYTLALWGTTLWVGRSSNLPVTTRMLQIATLLTIPINFWAMDEFALWRSGLGWLTVAIATPVLIGIVWFGLGRQPRLLTINTIALSLLHWGWAIPGIPLGATYVGVVGTATLLSQRRVEPEGDRTAAIVGVACATLLLLGRAMLGAQIPVSQLSLAFGICGWLLCWLAREARRGWAIAGATLMAIGWAVSAPTEVPWQAAAVSLLGIWILGDRLMRHWQLGDLVAIFLVGLQAWYLVGRSFPEATQEGVLSFSERLFGTAFMPAAVYGIGIYPHVILTVAGAMALQRLGRSRLARWAEYLALGLGALLTALSLPNPSIRAINLVVSSITLLVVLRQRQQPSLFLTLLTHVAGLGAIAACLYALFPTLPVWVWAVLAVAGAIAEWEYANFLGRRASATGEEVYPQAFRQAAWYTGAGLVAIAYPLFWQVDNNFINLCWLAVPLGLTRVATTLSQPNRLFPVPTLSIATAIALQPLTFTAGIPRLVALAAATAIAEVNTRQLHQAVLTVGLEPESSNLRQQRWEAAFTTVGLGVGFTIAQFYQLFPEGEFWHWLCFAAVDAFILWEWRDRLQQRENPLAQVYAPAFDIWGFTVMGGLLLVLSVINLVNYAVEVSLGDPILWGTVLAAAIALGTCTYRTWRQPSNLAFVWTAWSVETLAATVLNPGDRAGLSLGVTNLALGLGTQLAGDWWVRKSNGRYLTSWHGIPLVYAVLGWIALQWEASLAGLATLAAAWVLVGVGRREPDFPDFKPVTYLGVAGITGAAYQLLTYQLAKFPEGNPADGLAIYAMLAVVLAGGYRWLGRYATPVLRLGQTELTAIARLHWLAGMGFMLFAFWLTSFGQLSGLGIGAIALLGIHATLEGRSREEWTYAGITLLTVAIAQALNAFVPTSILVWWGAPVASGMASMLYFRDWERWGWSPRPWRGYATILPVGILLFVTFWRFASPPVVSLLIVAGFYAGLALSSRRIRLSYLSLFLANWAIAKIFNDSGIREPLWQLAVLCLSGLYLIQVEPSLRSPHSRDTRHWLRCLAVGLFCFRTSWRFGGDFVPGLLVAGVGVGLAIAGLGLRVRALLYVGTLTFAIQIARQLIVFASQYSLALWGLLTVVGAFFIWVAATFEARRTQMTRSLGDKLTELREWE